MPVYEYRCKACGKTHEIEHGFNDARPTACPSCGGQLVRVFHPVGVVFKGSGFHKTDYSGSGVRGGADKAGADNAAASAEKKSETKADGKSDTKVSSESGSATSKPADKPSSSTGSTPK